jgi:hypothetical protein
VRISSKCCFSLLFASVLAIPAFGQQANTSQQKSAGTQVVASTMDDLRERILLDRIEQLEKRLADLEGRAASAQAPAAAPPATTAPAAQEPAPATPPAQVPAATPSAQAPAAAPEPAPPTWSAGPIDFSGLVDGYYNLNFNHPSSQSNQLYNFDVKANQFSLNMAKLSLAHSPDPVGFQVDLGFGRAFEIIHANEPNTAPSFLRNIEQAYVSFKPAKAKGFEVDFGQFVTSDGAEVIETNGNWNYSRSLLFAWAIPYYHFGIRTSFPVGKSFTGGVMLVNGWNNVEDNNSGKTIMFTGTLTKKKFVWVGNYHTGPENTGTNKGWRNLFDTTLTLIPTSKVSAYINFDYGQNRTFSTPAVSSLAKWYGVAAALHYQFNAKWAFTPRLEWFKDRDGFSTGLAQDLKEFTVTGEYKMLEGLLARLEYRRDWSNQPFFQRGSVLDESGLGTYRNQDTLSIGVLAFFGPKR